MRSPDTDKTPGHGSTDDATPAHRYTADLAASIELGWQDRWDGDGTFETPNPSGSLAAPGEVARLGEKLFVLDMFPYPSGSDLHVGHPLGFVGTDVYVRLQRMAGRNVLYSMGFDSFGLPAEQYAVQHGLHPAVTTAQNIANFRRQLRRLGLSHDRRRSIETTDPAYFRWTQWIFSRIFDSWFDETANGGEGKARPIRELIAAFESGEVATSGGRPWSSLGAAEQAAEIDGRRLAYVAESEVNWCPGLGTIVANEEVTADGRSDKGNFPVFKRTMRQWNLRITAYADRLVDDLDLLDWPESIRAMQRNWIGRSVGAWVDFASDHGPVIVFTTRPDTLFGASFLVLAPEHPMVAALTVSELAPSVVEYRNAAVRRKDVDRQDLNRRKTGVFTGSYATNPVTGRDIPVWIADYVLMGYGSGAIMGVPGGDQRDFEFANEFGLDIPAIQEPPQAWFDGHGIDRTLNTARWPEAFVGNAPYVNSANATLDLNGVTSVEEATTKINDWLEAGGAGRATTTYRLRDWLFARQRYWGEPFPIVWDDDDRPHLVPDDQLPVELPETEEFSPRTFDPDDDQSEPESPLGRMTDWVEVAMDLGEGERTYRRDTNVMPQWAGSCWYELRYCDPHNTDAFIDPEVERYWVGPQPDVRADHPGGVDLYVGGVEHAVLHLLYARFWHKVLFDLGYLSSKEPYYRLFNQGYVLAAAYVDDRGIYVPADEVVADGGSYTYEGRTVSREWGKMGKSLKNAVSPDEIYTAYGADTLRLHLMASGPLDASRTWAPRDAVGMYRFLQRLWRNIVDEHTGEIRVAETELTDETNRILHRTVDAVSRDMQALRFNTAIAKLIEFNNHLTLLSATPAGAAEPLVLMVAPLAPHVAEELWSRLGHDTSLHRAAFPVADPAWLVDETVEIPVQVNGRVRGRVTVPVGASDDDVTAAALADAKVAGATAGAQPRKVIVVPGRMVNIVV